MEVIPQHHPLWCAQVDGKWIRSGRVVGWEYQPEQPGSAMLKPIIAWIARDCFEGGGDPLDSHLYLADEKLDAEGLAMRGPKGD
jgi:hypothetical protein